jgi:D-xylonolactonase
MRTAVDSVASIGATLGEGPVWLPRASQLWFVDIKQHKIHSFDPGQGVSRSWQAPAQVGWVLPAEDGSLVVGLQTGLHRFDPTAQSFSLIHAPERDRPGNRLNDATVDPAGRLWFGSMDDGETEASGRVYRVDHGVCSDSGLAPITITNGPAVSRDGTTLYHVDTLGKTIWQVPLGEDGLLGKPALFAEIEPGAGHPDGPVVDSEGCVWIGMFGGWAVRRYDPSGKLMRTVDFPVANVTKIAFGGDDLRTAYATTARKGLDAAALAGQPLAGDLFAFDPGVAGVAVTPAKI